MGFSLASGCGLVIVVITCSSACGGAIRADEDNDPSGTAEGRPSTPPSGAAEKPGNVGAAAEPGTSCSAPTTIETIVDLRSDPNLTTGRLLVDDGHLYVDTNKGMMRVPRCGGVATKIAENAPGQYTASGLVQNATSIFRAASAPNKGGFIQRIAKSGQRTEELASNGLDLFGLAAMPSSAAAVRLYWVERGANGSDELREMDIETGATKQLAFLPVAYSHGPFFADDAGVSFFSMSGSNNGTYSTWSSAGGRRTISSGPRAVDLVGAGTSGGDELYFSFAHTGADGVARLTRTSPSKPALVTSGKAPHGLARRGDSLYFTDISRGTVSRCTLDTQGICVVTVIAPVEDDPRFLTVDNDAVYWATRRGLLRRAPL